MRLYVYRYIILYPCSIQKLKLLIGIVKRIVKTHKYIFFYFHAYVVCINSLFYCSCRATKIYCSKLLPILHLHSHRLNHNMDLTVDCDKSRIIYYTKSIHPLH